MYVASYKVSVVCTFPRMLLNRIRGQDVQLLKALQVQLICDLMVEKKKTKYGMM